MLGLRALVEVQNAGAGVARPLAAVPLLDALAAVADPGAEPDVAPA